jgi:E1A-binding protein p400
MQLLMKRQAHGQQQPKAQIISTSPQTQIFSPANIQVGQNAGTGTQQITTLVKTSGTSASGSNTVTGNTLGTVGMTLSQVKQGTLKGPVANQNDSRFLALQPVTFTQQRKGATGKLTQIAQVSGKGGTQLIVQNPKSLPNTVTVQQLPHVLRHAQMTTGQIVLGKGSLGRIIPVSVSTQTNRTQTFQVVSPASGAQVLTSNLRAAHGTAQGLPNNPGIIKVTQQAAQLLSAQGNRQNASPIRLQANSSGSLVVVSPQTQQQQPQQQSSGTVTIQDTSGSSGQQSQQIIQQNQQTQQIQISQQSPQPSTQQQSTQNQQQTQQQPQQQQQQQQQVSMMKRK